MSKVEPRELVVREDALSLVPSAEDIDSGFEAPPTREYLPFLEMVFPIMLTDPIYKGHEYKLGFKEGGKFTPLPAGTVLTLVDKRNAARKKVKTPEGQVKNSYAFAAINRKGKDYNTTDAVYQDMVIAAKTDPTIDLGYSMVVVAILPDGRATLLDFSAYKTMASYLYPALSPSLLTNKIGLQIDIEDHSINNVKSKNGFFYPAANKFKQWKQIQLDKEQLSLAVEAVTNGAEAYMTWLNK